MNGKTKIQDKRVRRAGVMEEVRPMLEEGMKVHFKDFARALDLSVGTVHTDLHGGKRDGSTLPHLSPLEHKQKQRKWHCTT